MFELIKKAWLPVIFLCTKCGRRGEYRKETLLKEFDGGTSMPSLLKLFAAARGCALAASDLRGPPVNGAYECKIGYDVE